MNDEIEQNNNKLLEHVALPCDKVEACHCIIIIIKFDQHYFLKFNFQIYSLSYSGLFFLVHTVGDGN